MTKWQRLRHAFAHFFDWNTGCVDTFWKDDKLMVCFKCDGCGEQSGIHESVTERRWKQNNQ